MTRASIALALFLAACGPVVPVAGDATSNTSTASTVDEGDASADSGASSETTIGSVSGVATITTDPQDDGTAEQGGDVDDGGVGFIQDPDGGGKNLECDLWADDCPIGEKCMPWAYDGGSSWNATRCSPIAEDPNAVGEPCTVEGTGVSGVDDCVQHAMCWDVDPETHQGTCIAFCTGSEANPTCADPCESCAIASEGVLILCLPGCDPLLQECYEGGACYPERTGFYCSPDASGDMGQLGDECEFINVCDPGLFCANGDFVPGCASASGCCASFCDALAVDACAGMPGGVECIPWYEDGEAPSCFSGVVGACVVPE